MTEENKVVNAEPKEVHKPTVQLAKKTIGHNPLQLPFPKDPHGLNSALRTGGLKAAANVRGDKEKLKAMIQTAEVIVAHAKALYVRDVKRAKEAKANSISARARVAEKMQRQAEAKAREYEKAAALVREKAGLVEEPNTSEE